MSQRSRLSRLAAAFALACAFLFAGHRTCAPELVLEVPAAIAAPSFTGPAPATMEAHWWGTGRDDGPAIQAVVTSLSAVGGRLVLHGTIVVSTQITLPNTGAPVQIHLASGCVIQANVSGHAVFLTDSISPGGAPSGGFPLLTGAGAVAGATSVTVDGVKGLVAGNAVAIIDSANTYVETHTIRSTSTGVLGFTEPISTPTAAGAKVYLLPGLAQIQITGEPGSKITGSAMQGVQLKGCKNCLLRGFTIALSLTGTFPWSAYYDWGSSFSVAEDLEIVADGTNPGTTGFGLEQTTSVTLRRIRFRQSAAQFGNGGGAAVVSTNGRNLLIEDVSAPGSNIAVILEATDNGSGGHNTYGHHGTTVSGLDAADSNFGVVIRDEAGQGTQILNLYAPRAVKSAIVVDAPNTGIYANNVEIVGGDVTGCTSSSGAGAVTFLGGVGHRIKDLDASISAIALSVEGAASVAADGFRATNCTGTYTVGAFTNGTEVRLAHATLTGGTGYAIDVDSSTTGANTAITVVDSDITGSGTATNTGQALLYGGRVTLQNVIAGWRSDPGNIVSNGLRIGSIADVTLRGVTLLLPTTPAGTLVGVSVDTATATAWLDRVRVTHGGVTGPTGGATYGLITNAAATVFDMGGVDFSVTNNPITLTSGTLTNWGSFTATGSAVTISHVASPSPSAGFKFQLTSASGTVGAPFQATAISGGSVNVNSTNAADRSTYSWTLQAMLDPWAFVALARAIRRRLRRAPANDNATAKAAA